MTRHAERPLRCGECGEVMECVRSTVPYPESGLDNVWLVNVPVWQCSNGHEEYEVPAVQHLHDLLAETIVGKPGPLAGQELRYLRKHLGLSGREFAGYLGINPVSLSRIEHGTRAVTPTVDRLARLLHNQLRAAGTTPARVRDLVPVLQHLARVGNGAARRVDHRIEFLGTRLRETETATGLEWRELRT